MVGPMYSDEHPVDQMQTPALVRNADRHSIGRRDDHALDAARRGRCLAEIDLIKV